MRKKSINVSLKLKNEIVPETFFEKLLYFFLEQRFEWETLEDIHYVLKDGSELIIEKGFVCDLCSIPTFLHSFISPYGTTVKAYILHDFIYQKDYKREELGDKEGRLFADEEMLYQANLLDIEKQKLNRFLFKGVRLFGRKVFKRSANQEE